ncbi:MAG: excisionase family DNA-binding protein [Planctomycetales bacterium]|nr:excisionase family DNA-binding protein [Planctomycetales bacterium]NIM09961.1 excisionase family DNA-binding protein [Planctomycetales bacterium]NIN09401.1 excisionase family DNA-binding protein [Planctomycetales bacterium]NIN78508.1 excisionase family DNA-binding protein [Planctomycetales bacterium]NIO35701.1 excisionase family DNA-binding protein [Planctomycetales bacterium]
MTPMKRPANPHPELAGTVSIAEAARRLNLTHKQVRHLLATRILNFTQIRGKFRIPADEVTTLAARRGRANPAHPPRLPR